MSAEQSFQVAGVDGCKAGWVIAVAAAEKTGDRSDICRVLKAERISVAKNFGEVLAVTKDAKLVCVDIPIGLSDGPPRDCDLIARRVLGAPRASSVFPAPVRQSLACNEYKNASDINFRFSGRKLSRQSFAILGKIREVDELICPALQQRVREIHPEIAFWALNDGKAMQHSKKTAPGYAERLKLLKTVFVGIEDILEQGRPSKTDVDDLLDAFAAAWVAGQSVVRKAGTLPETPILDSKGLRMEILCPIK